jgi:spermidine synthase
MTLDERWFTEICEECGSAFSLRLTGAGKLHEERTPYQTIAIYETETFGRLMTIDGFVMLTARDNFVYHEMMTHPVLFSHPAPRQVLIVGGGDCGALKEVLKHPEVERVTQVDIDERVTRLSERYFPELCASNDDPRARLEFRDALEWIKTAAPGSLDVIIVDSTDPLGPAEGLFGAAFYADCRRALAPGGLLVHQSESPWFHKDSITVPMRRAMREAGFGGLTTLFFPQCTYPTGWWTATIAGRDGPVAFTRQDEAARKPFPTRYYNVDTHRAALAVPEFLKPDLAPV